jgi:hypothetical protein
VVTYPRAILDIEDFTESQNWLVHGDTGSGKTPWCCTQPRTLILGVDNQGTISARQSAPKGTKVWPIHKWPDFEEAFKFIWKNPSAFDWVVVDTVTMAQTRLMRHILEMEYKRNPGKRRNTYIPEIQDHQMWQNQLKRFVMDFNELPVNMIWTAQSFEREDAEGNPQVWPLLPGGKQGYEMAAWLVAQMHVIGYMRVLRAKGPKGVRSVRKMLFDKRPPYIARDRFGVLPPEVTVRDGTIDKVTIGQLTALIAKAPDAVRQRAQKRVEEFDDNVELDPTEARPVRKAVPAKAPARTARRPARKPTEGAK